MISVVIPALNEESTVGRVVEIASLCKGVDEVIVVDDKSSDNTIAEARKAGAKVVTSTKLGKGVSMRDGIHVARNEVIAFLDADIVSYRENVVELLTEPIVKGESDFVKSYFSRQADRVTELVAKPLLSILYPEFPTFKQPLSGMIAGRKKMFLECSLEDGYGVDIGILIDMYRLGARIKEVNIGIIENRMQALSQLGRMSREVARTIIMKTKESAARNLETYENIQVIREQMEYAIREGLMSLKKIAMFDMDNTILRASFIQTASDRFGFRKQLTDIVTNSDNPFIRTKQIARLLRGRSIGEMLETVDGIDVTANLSSLLMHLKAQGYIIGIISDSYDCITNHIKNRFGFDFTISH
jgi:glucosyl-3-phosphoglycerate synthase